MSVSTKSLWNQASGAFLDPLTASEPYQDEDFRFNNRPTAASPLQPPSLAPRRPPSNPFNTTTTAAASSSNPFTNPRLSRPDYARSISSDSGLRPSPKPTTPPHRSRTVKSPRTHRTHTRAMPTDTIDGLDTTFGGIAYHHEGPYDATLAARQIPGRAPVDAVKLGNAAALAATPRANIMDSLERGVPLQGVGMVPPGQVGLGGQRFEYQEEDVQRGPGGRLGRWDDVEYLDSDIKGKGQPGYTQDELDKANAARRHRAGGEKGHHYIAGGEESSMEMHRSSSLSKRATTTNATPYNDDAEFDGQAEKASGSKLSGLVKKLSVRRRK